MSVLCRISYFIGLALIGFRAFAQPNPVATVTGRVTDAATGEPLPFATVYINSTTRGTTSDESGNYSLAGVPAGTVEIIASYVGHKPARSTVKVAPSATMTVNLALAPMNNALTDVTVTAKRSRAWERLLRRFRHELFGDSPFTGRCVLINEDAVMLLQEGGKLRATAKEPLVIENRALGYRLHYDLLSFENEGTATYYSGTGRFDELTPDSPEQRRRWQRNRQTAYEGSSRHLLASMVANTCQQEGFLVYKSGISPNTNRSPYMPMLQFEGGGPREPAPVAEFFQPGELPNERRLVLTYPLEIFYTRAGIRPRQSPYRDMPFAYTMLVLPNRTAVITTDGWVVQPNGLEMRGYLGNDRLANLLPADWRPPTDALATPSTLAQATVLPPDTRLDSLKRDWRKRQAATPPTVYLHTDKTLYTTGDRVWFSAYVLNATSFAPLTAQPGEGDAAFHLDWVSPAGQTLWHQWVRIRNGRGEGSFQLPDSLRTGHYTLRAYTENGRQAHRPAFEQTILVSSGISQAAPLNELPDGAPSVDRALPVASTDSTSLRLGVKTDSVRMQIQIQAPRSYLNRHVYLTIQHRDRYIGQAKIQLQNGAATLTVPLTNIPDGIVRLTLFDANGQARDEQLITLPTELVRVAITTDKVRYMPRETALVTIQVQNDTGEGAPAFLSASVTDADQLPPDLPTSAIRSHLLTRPAVETTLNPAPPDSSLGIVLHGRILDARNRPVPNAKLLLTFVGKDESFARSAKADAEGRFRVDGLTLVDSVQVTPQVMNDDFKPIRADVRLDAPGGPVGDRQWPVSSGAAPNWGRYAAAIRAARIRQAEVPEQYRLSDAKQLAEVTVKAAKPDDDSRARRISLHGEPDAKVVFDERANQYPNVYEMMRGKLPGVDVRVHPNNPGGYKVVIRGVGSFGQGNAPLYVWDGQYIEENGDGNALMMINASEVERIEVVKNATAAIYGARGGAGVIAIFTRTWKPDQINSKRGPDDLLVMGYQTSRPFPAPPADPARTDRRDVLAWQPLLQTDAQGRVSLSVPLSDVVRTLRVTIQGITSQGIPVSVERLIRVQ